MAGMTKEELQAKVEELEATVAHLTQRLQDTIVDNARREYEMLQRMYPYLANEIDHLREGHQRKAEKDGI